MARILILALLMMLVSCTRTPPKIPAAPSAESIARHPTTGGGFLYLPDFKVTLDTTSNALISTEGKIKSHKDLINLIIKSKYGEANSILQHHTEELYFTAYKSAEILYKQHSDSNWNCRTAKLVLDIMNKYPESAWQYYKAQSDLYEKQIQDTLSAIESRKRLRATDLLLVKRPVTFGTLK